jgi:hypothetical protein
MRYNPQPQCDKCAKFIPYERAIMGYRSDGMPEPSPEEYWSGLCDACEPTPPTREEAQ